MQVKCADNVEDFSELSVWMALLKINDEPSTRTRSISQLGLCHSECSATFTYCVPKGMGRTNRCLHVSHASSAGSDSDRRVPI